MLEDVCAVGVIIRFLVGQRPWKTKQEWVGCADVARVGRLLEVYSYGGGDTRDL